MIPLDTPHGMDNCGIAAVAMLASVPYRDAERLFFDLCNRHDITSIWDRMLVIDALGLTVLEEKHYRDKPTLNGWFVSTYSDHHTSDYHVTFTNHAVAVRGGMVYDPIYRDGIPLVISPYTRKRVSSYLRLGAINDYDHRYHL